MSTLSYNNIAEAVYLSLKDKGHAEAKDTTGKIIKFLARKRLLAKSKDILRSLELIINKEEGIILIQVWSVAKLGEDIKRNIHSFFQKKFNAKKVIIEEHIDNTILGGYKIKVNDEVIDNTFYKRLATLQEHLTKS